MSQHVMMEVYKFMQIFQLLIEIGKVIAGAVLTSIPLVIAIRKKIKELKKAKTDAEQLAAINDIRSKAKSLVETAEEAYRDVDSIMKSQHLGTAGVFKKESVQAKLEAYSSRRGYAFTEDELSDIIEEEVSFTNSVNVSK